MKRAELIDALFSPHAIGSRTAPNRFVAQAMEGSDAAPDGGVSERALARYLRLAEGRWGIVFVEATSVTSTSLARLDGMLLSEETAPSFRELVARFKAANPDAVLMIQLTHSGGLSHPDTDRTTSTPGHADGYRPLSGDEIERTRLQFIAGARLAADVGFDGIDFKQCHGYFGAELLRPANVRDDGWGGSFTDRTRFFRSAIQDIRDAVLRDYPSFIVGSRMSFHERVPGGCGTAGPGSTDYDPTDSLALVRQMTELGLDYVNVSGEAPTSEDTSLEPEERLVRTLHYERLARTEIDTINAGRSPIAVIGSGYSELRAASLSVATKRLHNRFTDFVGFGRQSFADPLLPLKTLNGGTVRFCTVCDGCARLMLSGRPAYCVVYDRKPTRAHELKE